MKATDSWTGHCVSDGDAFVYWLSLRATSHLDQHQQRARQLVADKTNLITAPRTVVGAETSSRPQRWSTRARVRRCCHSQAIRRRAPHRRESAPSAVCQRPTTHPRRRRARDSGKVWPERKTDSWLVSGTGFVKEALRGSRGPIYLSRARGGRRSQLRFNALRARTNAVGVRPWVLHHGRDIEQAIQAGLTVAIFRRLGLRIAHSSETRSFSRALPLRRDCSALVAERLGAARELLEDVRKVEGPFQLAAPVLEDRGMFLGFAPGNQQWNHVVARRLRTIPWTAYYLIPQQTLKGDIARIVQGKLVLAAGIMLLAVLVGSAFAEVILRPIHMLSAAARAIAAGQPGARRKHQETRRTGAVGETFNDMAPGSSPGCCAGAAVRGQYRALFESLTEGFAPLKSFSMRGAGKAVDY